MRSLSLLFLTTLPLVVLSISCPSGFSVINNSRCVRIFPNPLKHGEAETDCRYLGGTLVNIKNSIDNRVFSEIAATAGAERIWIGTYCFDKTNETACYYDDNSGEVAYSNFLNGFPKTIGAYGGCVYMLTAAVPNAGRWISAKCEVEGLPFICEVPPTGTDACTYNYNGYCYFPSTELSTSYSQKNFTNAQSTCSSLYSANLASIHSMRELDYVKSLFKDTTVGQITLGASSSLPEVFNWVDGSPTDFSYMWPMGQTGADKNCLQMDLTNYGLWSEVPCYKENYFVCKRRVSNGGTEHPIAQQPIILDPYDFSNCNNTFLMAPGMITSIGFPNTPNPPSFCTWRIVTMRPYRLAFFFTTFYTDASVKLYDEYGTLFANTYYGPTTTYAPTNIATVTFQETGKEGLKGFSATIMPV